MRSKQIVFILKLGLAALIFFVCITVTVFGGTFVDIDAEDSEKVEIISDLGFLYYDLVPYFSPDKIITRKEAAEIMYILDKGYFYNDGKISFVSSFTDVYRNDYVINYCRENGLLRGFSDGSFRPNNPISCAEIIEMFVKTLGFEKDKVLEFPGEYLSVAADIGLLNGVEFNSEDYVTNLTAAKLVFNALTLPLYPVVGMQNLLETRFSGLYKTVLETNDRIERMLCMIEDVDGMDIALINADFAMITECFRQLSSVNVNCEFKFNHKMQYMRKMNGYMNLIAELRGELNEIDATEVYVNFDRYSTIISDLEAYNELINSNPNYEKRWLDIYYNAVLNIYDLYERMLISIGQRLPNMAYFIQDFNKLESSVLTALESDVISTRTPVDFYDENNWIIALINQYSQTEQLYNFLSERDMIDDSSYYGRMLEITYIIRSIYYIKGCEYSMTAELETEFSMAEGYFAISRELRDEMSRMEFIYYKERAVEIIERFDELLME